MDIEINSEILYKARVLRATIVEIPATLDWGSQRDQATTGGRRISSLRPGRSTAAYVFSGFLFRPMVLFVLPGFVLLALAVGSSATPPTSPGSATSTTTPATSWPAGVSLVLSTQLIIVGVLAIQAKRYFEELFHLGTSILPALPRATRGWLRQPLVLTRGTAPVDLQR